MRMPWIKKSTLLVLFILSPSIFTQSIMEEISGPEAEDRLENYDLITEQVLKISPSRRILLLSNKNSSYNRGDFISLVLGDKLVARCLVAKIEPVGAGIKITKIYNNALWKKIRPKINVQIIRGDDSYFTVKAKEKAKETPLKLEIQDEEDLYNQITLLEDDLKLDDSDRVIKIDNIITAFLGFVEGVDLRGNVKTYRQINGSWMYQITDNVWLEFNYGQNIINDFPYNGIDTKFSNFTFKAKYIFAAPFSSFLQPYVGFQMLRAFSPGAGLPDGNASEEELDIELNRLEKLRKQSGVVGVTILKRLVPGWLGRIDLGLDLVSFGFGLEF